MKTKSSEEAKKLLQKKTTMEEKKETEPADQEPSKEMMRCQVLLPESSFEALRLRAFKKRISISKMARIIIETALSSKNQ